MMKHVFLAVGLCALAFAGIAFDAAAQEVAVRSVTEVCETLGEGEKAVAYVVEYAENFTAGTPVLGSYTVRGRELTRVYVNDSGKLGDVRYSGRFVVIELAVSQVPGNAVGSTLLWGRMNGIPNRVNHRLPPDAVIVQTADLTSEAGNTALSQRLDVTRRINPLVDSFESFYFTDPKNGLQMKYRLYVPAEALTGKKLPLVVFLHGSGERGANNASQLLANPSALEFARAAAQAKHPCYVLAPQNPNTLQGWSENYGTDATPNWGTTDQLNTVKSIIDHLVKTQGVDTARIYGTGLSQGSMGLMIQVMNHPGMYAAMLNAPGCNVYEDAAVARGVKTPIWHLVSEDDGSTPAVNTRKLMTQYEKAGATVVRRMGDRAWNGFLRGAPQFALATEQWNEAKAKGTNVLYTEYVPGTVLPSAHWSWMTTFSNDVVRDWLFSHVNPTPYTPE